MESLEYGIGYVTLGVSMGGIEEIPQGRSGTARLLLNPELPVSSTLSEHDVFLLRGSNTMLEQTPPPATGRCRNLGKIDPF